MEPRTKKALLTLVICASLPLVAATDMPLTFIGAIVSGIVFVNMPSEDVVPDEKLGDVVVHGTEEDANRLRARPVTC